MTFQFYYKPFLEIVKGLEKFFYIAFLVVVTVVFYYILDYFNTAYIVPSTISVTTSFIAVYLTFRRNPYFALAYASNDIVLIILWTLASIYEIRYVSVVVCFIAFFVNDIYGYISWEKMKKRQNKVIGRGLYSLDLVG